MENLLFLGVPILKHIRVCLLRVKSKPQVGRVLLLREASRKSQKLSPFIKNGVKYENIQHTWAQLFKSSLA